MPQREGLPNAVIAVWGKLELKQLDASDVSILASGGSPHQGILVSFLGDLQRSAKLGVPVYQLASGAGYLWVATFNQDGKGVLRFLTIDASQIARSIARPVPPSETAVRPSPTISVAAECLAPTKQSQLQTISECTNAMCCPRELNLQINLVRAVAQKLKALGYTIADPKAQPEDFPDLSGIYYPALRSAVSQYKQDHKLANGNADITYELVATLLGVNLFERWR